MSSTEGKVPVYVWDLVVRSTHWIIFLAILVLSVTGFYIGDPFVIASGEATRVFVMGYMKIVHSYAAIAFSAAVLLRLGWMFIGPRYARWTQFVPTTRERFAHLIGTAKFYSFLRPAPPPTVGHNALAGAAYVAVFGLYLVMIFTGFALYAMSASVDSIMAKFTFLLPFFGGPQSARWIHHVVMYLLLGFAVHHVYSASLMAKVEKNGTMDSIFGGYKLIPPSELPPSERHG
jgi:Ni/Fe-hydrogenase 1 B-type cytochrome subunit